MFSYQRNPHWTWEDAAATSLTGLVILAAIVLAAVAATILIILLTEIGRVFARRAFAPTKTARVLWGALLVLLTLWAIAGVLALQTVTVALALLVASWAFLAFAVVVEACEVSERRFDGDSENLDAYLDFRPTEPSQNGKASLTPTLSH